RRQVMAAVRVVAERLRNTPTVCRSSYIHPAVLEAYASGKEVLPQRAVPPDLHQPPIGLSAAEKAVLRFLRTWKPASSPVTPLTPVRSVTPSRRAAARKTRQAA